MERCLASLWRDKCEAVRRDRRVLAPFYSDAIEPNLRLLRRPIMRRSRSVQQNRVPALLALVQLGYAHWFFGNLYEGVVKVPELLSKVNALEGDDRPPMSVLSSGSPVRYYLPGIPVVIGATLLAVLGGWRFRRERLWFAFLAVSTLFGVVTTAYLVRNVNLKLVYSCQRITPVDRAELLKVWYRGNLLRLISSGSAWVIVSWLASRFRQHLGK